MNIRLIVLSPSVRRIRQFRFDRSVFTFLGFVLMGSFLAAATIAYTFPRRIDDKEYSQLEAENRALAVEHQSKAFEAQRLKARIARMEQTSDRIVHELQAD